MSIIRAIFSNTNNVSSYADAFQASDRTSTWMKTAIAAWFDLYFVQDKTEDSDPCQQIPYTIVRKLTKAVFSEYQTTTKDAYAEMVLDSLNKKATDALQMALIGGECLLKPIPTRTGWRWNVINRANVLVFGRDDDGRMTDIGTAESTVSDKHYYTLLERRTMDDRGYLTIQNKLYRSDMPGTLGQRVPLATMLKYADLPESYTFPQPIWSIGLVQFKTPMANCVDGSADGVSVYAAAVELIRNINRNEAQINGEFERGESRIITSSDMLKRDKNGKHSFSDHLFVGLDDDPDTVGVTIFSPELREASFLARKQEYLRNVENVIGLKRGLLSEVEAVERTAKEITSSEGEYSLTVIDFQQMWEKVIAEALRLCGILGKLYKVPGAHEVSIDAVAISWGNGVLYDEEKVYKEMKEQVSMNLLQPERLLGWYYDLPADTPAQRAKIRKDYMPEVAPEEDE